MCAPQTARWPCCSPRLRRSSGLPSALITPSAALQSAAPPPSSPINIARQTQSADETTFNRECLCQKRYPRLLACFTPCSLAQMGSLSVPIPCYLLPPTSNRPFPFVYTPNGIKPKLLLLLLQHQLPAFFVRSPLLLFAKPSGWKNYSRCDNFFLFLCVTINIRSSLLLLRRRGLYRPSFLNRSCGHNGIGR